MWDLFLLPTDTLVYINHLGILRVLWCWVTHWALTEGMKKTDTSISQRSRQYHRQKYAERERKRVFFLPQWAVAYFIFSYLRGFIVSCSLIEPVHNDMTDWLTDWVSVYVFACACACASMCLFAYVWVYLCMSFQCLCESAYREKPHILWNRFPAATHCEDNP